jgi:hypothetical protein
MLIALVALKIAVLVIPQISEAIVNNFVFAKQQS